MAFITSTPGVIVNNVVTNNRAVGIHVWHAPHDLLITDNRVMRNGHSGIVVGGAERAAHGIIVRDNIVLDNHGKGLFQTGKNRPGNRYTNNVVARNGRGNVVLNGATDDGTNGSSGPPRPEDRGRSCPEPPRSPPPGGGGPAPARKPAAPAGPPSQAAAEAKRVTTTLSVAEHAKETTRHEQG